MLFPRFSSRALAAAHVHAAAEHPREACGLLLGRTGLVEEAVPCANVAADPARRFEIDPAVLLSAHRRARDGGPAVLGCYHSHPSGRAEPSAQDAADAASDGGLWLILAGAEARLWRAVPSGATHGRFDPVPLACEGEAAPAQAQLPAGDPHDR